MEGNTSTSTTETVLPEQSLSVAGRPLPPPPSDDTARGGASIVLFYQYKEPEWAESEFQKALKLFLGIGREFSITGRGRMAPEGVNCTLTGPSASQMRGFCQALRDRWKDSFPDDGDLFHETDFKITDGLPQSQKFKSLSIRKTNELVAYGLEGEKAPSLKQFGGTHLNAMDYHTALQDKDTVVIDVRNAYETAIGTIVPPKGGATLLDPKLRNSREWPKWLASEDTQKKNYLFDKRMEQLPERKEISKVEDEVATKLHAKCCLCRKPWTTYRGQHKCREIQCGVPVLVCDACHQSLASATTTTTIAVTPRLMCELCREGYRAPQGNPDLVAMRKRAEKLAAEQRQSPPENDTTTTELHSCALA